MSCYFIARIRIRDNDEYNRYLSGAGEVFARYNGRYLAVDTQPETLEGEPFPGRIVLIEFPGREDLHRWYRSAEYQQILAHRLHAALCETVVAEGL